MLDETKNTDATNAPEETTADSLSTQLSDASAEETSAEETSQEGTEAGLPGEEGEAEESESSDDAGLPGEAEESSDTEEEGDEQEAVEGAPEEYEAFAVEGAYAVSEDQHKALAAVGKEYNLPHKTVQAFVKLDNDRTLIAKKQFDKENQAGLAASRAEFGDKFDEMRQVGNEAFKTFFPESIRKKLNAYGISYDPDFFKAIHKMGKSISEDSFVQGGSGVKDKANQTLAQKLSG